MSETKELENKEGNAPAGTVKKTISVDSEILARGLERAAEVNRNFSNYVAWLIDQDAKRENQQQAA